MRPSDRKYLASHEWAKIDGDVVIIGITDFAVDALSDLTHIDLPEAGDTVAANEPCGEIESVKTVSDILAPISGEVIEANEGLVDDENFDLLKESAFEDGWLIKIKPDNIAELEKMMDAAAYEKTLENE